MNTKRQPCVYLVEMRINDKWEPTVGATLTRNKAREELREWRNANPSDKFRVSKYERIGP